MNVLIVQTGEPLHIDSGNPRPMRAMNLANRLIEHGHRVCIISSAFYHQEKRHRCKKLQTFRVNNHLDIMLVPSRGYDRNIGVGRLIDHYQLSRNLSKILKKEDNLPDVAFIGYPPIETAAVMVRWLFNKGVPTLLDVKDLWPTMFLDAMPNWFKPIGRIALWPYFYYGRRAMQEASGLSAMAPAFLDWTLKFSGRVKTENDGVFPLTSPSGLVTKEQLQSARVWWNEKGVVDDSKVRICFIGSFMSVFDFKPIKQAAILANTNNIPIEFVLCGDGGSFEQIKSMMYGLTNVIFPGWIDRPKIEALAERSDASLAPYLNIDNFKVNTPNKIIDALSLGLPILSPLTGEVEKLIDNYKVGLRYGTDTGRDLYDCIQVLINNDGYQKFISNNAKNLYINKFSFDSVYDSLVSHLEKMNENNKRRLPKN